MALRPVFEVPPRILTGVLGDMYYVSGATGLLVPVEDLPAAGSGGGEVPMRQTDGSVVWTVLIGAASGTGSPEGVVTGTVGKLYIQTDGAMGEVLWVKKSGTSTTGWDQIAHQLTGTGSPEGVVTAPIGRIFVQSDASPTASALWYKRTGSGNTGWVQITAGGSGGSSIVGAGSPEGVEVADPGTLYVQTDAVSGQGLWYKETGTGNTGWQAVGGSAGTGLVSAFVFGFDA